MLQSSEAPIAPGEQVAIVMPVYNDWQSFRTLVAHLEALANTLDDVQFDIVAVDDGSTSSPQPSFIADIPLNRLRRVDVLHLACNLGHQRAIAIGLSEV